jgi:hypothetical protein
MASMSATVTPGHEGSAASARDGRREQHNGPNAPANSDEEALAVAHAEARTRAEAGDLTGARTLLEDALGVGELRLGHAHPRLAPLMVDLATIARNLGNLTEARTQLRRAYAIIVTASGPEHATALSIEGRLAAVTYRLGEPTEAYDWHLADVGARILGEEHPAVRGARQRLATMQERHAAEARAAVLPPEPDLDLDPEPGYAPTYAPSAHEPGVFHRVAPPDEPNIYVVEPPPRTYQDIEVWDEPPLPDARRSRGHRGGVAIVASLGAAILIGAVVIAVQLVGQLQDRETNRAEPPPPTTVPTTTPAAAPAPTGVTIQDNGGSVTLTWVDPSNGTVPFIVAGGRDGAESTPLETVPAGRTTSTIYGLNVNYNYCYTVTAVWSADMIAPSPRTCTKRVSTTSTP